MTFLMRDERLGTRAGFGVPYTAFPWAVTRSGQIVYIDCKDDPQAPKTPVSPPLVPYTKALSMERRRRCQSELGDLALKQRALTSAAVLKVSLGVNAYIRQCLKSGKPITTEIAACTGKYMYSPAGFGRLGQPGDKPKDDQTLYQTALETLTSGSLASVLAIHDFMGRVIFAKLKGSTEQEAVFNRTGSGVRPAYIFGDPQTDSPQKIEQLRGRSARPHAPGPTTAKGLLPDTGDGTTQLRERGIDKWMPASTNLPGATIDIQQRNLLFGAGPSGSTGTLLQAGMLFGNLDGELLRQYVLAIVGYLVGGGMHSYHEVMVIARMAGCPYSDGAYVPSLPESFLRTPDFTKWRDDFWDIVVLGGKLWFLDSAPLAVGRLDSRRVSDFEKLFKPRLGS
jgi:hypothetical protein